MRLQKHGKRRFNRDIKCTDNSDVAHHSLDLFLLDEQQRDK